jgi:hypothetical protein
MTNADAVYEHSVRVLEAGKRWDTWEGEIPGPDAVTKNQDMAAYVAAIEALEHARFAFDNKHYELGVVGVLIAAYVPDYDELNVSEILERMHKIADNTALEEEERWNRLEMIKKYEEARAEELDRRARPVILNFNPGPHFDDMVTEANGNGSHVETVSAEGPKTIDDVFPDYDQSSFQEIMEALPSLSEEEVQIVKDYEAQNQERPKILNYQPALQEEEVSTPEEAPEEEQVAEVPAAEPDTQWAGEEEESKEYEQEVPEEASAKPKTMNDVFAKHWPEDPNYEKRRDRTIIPKLPEFSTEDLQFFLEQESSGLHRKPRPKVIEAINNVLMTRSLGEQVAPEPESNLVRAEEVVDTGAGGYIGARPEPQQEEPKFDPTSGKMSTPEEIQEARQEREEQIEEALQPRQEEMEEKRQERVKARGSSGGALEVHANLHTGEVETRDILPRQQGAIHDAELDQRVLLEVARLGLPEPQKPEEHPQLPRETDPSSLTPERLAHQILLWAAHEGYASYHAHQWEAERVAKKALADKAANELADTIGLMDADGRHRKLERQVEAEVENHPTVTRYREDQRFAEAMNKRLEGHAAFYGLGKWGLSRIQTSRQEQQGRG